MIEKRNYEPISREKAIARLKLLYGINNPTEHQIAMYMLYGPNIKYVAINEELDDDLLRV